MNYYCQPTRFTEIKTEQWLISRLRPDMDFLFDCVKSILIHPMNAARQKVKYDRSKGKIFHAANTTVEQILKYERLAPFLKEKILPLRTSPQDRAVLSCDHHALLFTSFCRHLGISIRARTGFSKYLVKGMLIPHWVTEIHDENSKTWMLTDPERRLTSVDRDDFLLAHQAWKYFKEHPEARIPSYSGLSGWQGLKYALICDLNCVFKNELLGYEWRLKTFNREKPAIVRNSFERLDPEQQEAVEMIAGLLSDPDENTEELWGLYDKHIHEPGTVPPFRS